MISWPYSRMTLSLYTEGLACFDGWYWGAQTLLHAVRKAVLGSTAIWWMWSCCSGGTAARFSQLTVVWSIAHHQYCWLLQGRQELWRKPPDEQLAIHFAVVITGGILCKKTGRSPQWNNRLCQLRLPKSVPLLEALDGCRWHWWQAVCYPSTPCCSSSWWWARSRPRTPPSCFPSHVFLDYAGRVLYGRQCPWIPYRHRISTGPIQESYFME